MLGRAGMAKQHLGDLPQAGLLRAAVDGLKHQAQLAALLHGQAPVNRNGATEKRAPEPLDLLKAVERVGVEQHERGQRRAGRSPVKDKELDVSAGISIAQMQAVGGYDRAAEIERCRTFADRKLTRNRDERQHAAVTLRRPEDELIHPCMGRHRREIATPSGAG